MYVNVAVLQAVLVLPLHTVLTVFDEVMVCSVPGANSILVTVPPTCPAGLRELVMTLPSKSEESYA